MSGIGGPGSSSGPVDRRGGSQRSIAPSGLSSDPRCDWVLALPSQGFALGLRLVGLAARIGPVDRLRTAARPTLLDLRDRTGETANLLIRDGHTVLYLDQVESQLALRHSGWVGRTVPLAGTAVGAALLGHAGAQVAVNAVEVGVTAVACWVPATEDPAAVVSVTGPSARLRGISLQRARDAVEAAATTISESLAHANGRS